MAIWLLPSKNGKLIKFRDHDIPPYAILSHTWEYDRGKSNELTFEDVKDGSFERKPSSFVKLRKCLEQAQNIGLDWVWVDNVCIDRKSHAALTDALNSMFPWYQRASICFAYLGDVQNVRDLNAARWFTRGWTLQELLAPTEVWFFNRSWARIGTRQSLVHVIARITGIDRSFLLSAWIPSFVHITKLWYTIQKRDTGIPEDKAYCLQGLLGVTLEPQYGEGVERAFERLYKATAVQNGGESPFNMEEWNMLESGWNDGQINDQDDDQDHDSDDSDDSPPPPPPRPPPSTAGIAYPIADTTVGMQIHYDDIDSRGRHVYEEDVKGDFHVWHTQRQLAAARQYEAQSYH